jgi:hypothetical protein
MRKVAAADLTSADPEGRAELSSEAIERAARGKPPRFEALPMQILLDALELLA